MEKDLIKKMEKIAETEVGDQVNQELKSRQEESIKNQITQGVLNHLAEYGIDDIDVIDIRKKTSDKKKNQYGWDVGKKLYFKSNTGKFVEVTVEKVLSNDSFEVADPDLQKMQVYGWELFETPEEAKEASKKTAQEETHFFSNEQLKNLGVNNPKKGDKFGFLDGTYELVRPDKEDMEDDKGVLHPYDGWWVKLLEEDAEDKLHYELDMESSKFKGTVKVSNVDITDGIVNSFEFGSTQIKKAYLVETYHVLIPSRGKYASEATNEQVALNNVIKYIYGDTGLSPDERARLTGQMETGEIKVEKVPEVQPVTQPTNQPVVVVQEFPDVKKESRTFEDKEDEIIRIAKTGLESEIDNKVQEDIKNAIKAQLVAKIQTTINDLGIPVDITDIDLENKSASYEGEDLDGSFVFDAIIEDETVKNVEPNLDSLKGKYGIKQIEVELGDRLFLTDASDEIEAVRKVLGYLDSQKEQLTFEGRIVSSKTIDEENIKVLAENQTRIIKLYQIPEASLGVWKLTENEQGQKVFERT